MKKASFEAFFCIKQAPRSEPICLSRKELSQMCFSDTGITRLSFTALYEKLE